MKTLLITISTLALMFNNNSDSNTKTVSDNTNLNQIEQTQSENSIEVRACNYEGEIIPSVQLPTFNVIGEKTKLQMKEFFTIGFVYKINRKVMRAKRIR